MKRKGRFPYEFDSNLIPKISHDIFSMHHDLRKYNILGKPVCNPGYKISQKCSHYSNSSFSENSIKVRVNALNDKRIGNLDNDRSENDKYLDKFSFYLKNTHNQSLPYSLTANICGLSSLSFHESQLESFKSFFSELNNNDVQCTDNLIYSQNNSIKSGYTLEGITSFLNLQRTISSHSKSVCKTIPIFSQVESEWDMVKSSMNLTPILCENQTTDSFDHILAEIALDPSSCTPIKCESFIRNSFESINNPPNSSLHIGLSDDFYMDSNSLSKLIFPDRGSIINKFHYNDSSFLNDISLQFSSVNSISEFYSVFERCLTILSKVDIQTRLMEGVTLLCEGIVYFPLKSIKFSTQITNYLDVMNLSIACLCCLHKQSVFSFFLQNTFQLRKIFMAEHSFKDNQDILKAVLLLYFLFSSLDIHLVRNKSIITLGLNISSIIFSKYSFQELEDVIYFLLLSHSIYRIIIYFNIFVPEPLTFLTKFLSLYLYSDVCFPSFSKSTDLQYLSKISIRNAKFPQDLGKYGIQFHTDWKHSQKYFSSDLLYSALILLSNYLEFYHDSSYLLSNIPHLYENLKQLGNHKELPVKFKYIIETCLHFFINRFQICNDNLQFSRFKSISIKFLDIEEPQKFKCNSNISRCSHKPTYRRYHREYTDVLKKIRNTNTMSLNKLVNQEIAKDISRIDKVDAIHRSIQSETMKIK